MANKIAEFFGELGFKVNEKGLRNFENQMKRVKKDFDSADGVTGKASKARTQSSKFFNEIKTNYSKVRPSLNQMRTDLGRIDEAFKQNKLSNEEYVESRRRVIERIGQLEKQKESAHQRALSERSKQQERISKEELRQSQRKKKSLNDIFKKYDKQGSKLSELRRDFRYLNSEYKRGNVTLENRERQLREIHHQYRRIQAAQAATSRGGVGPFAGGADPRQRGTHGLISALHSDAVLGSAAAGLVAAGSVRSYQRFKAMEQGLAAATGSVEQASSEMEYLHQLANEMGLFVGDLGEDYAKFAASARDTSLTVEDQRDVFKGVAAQVKILNLSAADSKRIFRA